MNPSFVLVLKSERCIDMQNRQLSFLVKRDAKTEFESESENARKEEFLFTNTDEKGLNVE